MSENLELYKSITSILHDMGCAYVLLVGENGANGVHTFSNLEHLKGGKLDKMMAAEKMEDALRQHFSAKFKKEPTSS